MHSPVVKILIFLFSILKYIPILEVRPLRLHLQLQLQNLLLLEKKVGKKDLAMQAISYGNVYVAQIAMGANPQQTLLAMREAEAFPGPSLILAYSHCIAHGIDMEKGLNQQNLAADSGYWPLIRYNPTLRKGGRNPFVLDSPRPTIKLKDYAYNELRYSILTRTNPDEAERLMIIAQEMVDLRWQTYEDMSTWKSSDFQPVI